MGAKWIRISIFYLILGLAFGFYMHMTVQLQWGATHAHINVVGWLSTGLIGAIYSIYPDAGNSALGKFHFWTYNIGLPFLLAGMMYIYLTPTKWVLEVLVIGGGGLVLIGIIAFLINAFVNIHSR